MFWTHFLFWLQCTEVSPGPLSLSLPCSTSKYEYHSPSNSKSQKKMMYSVDVSNMILPWSEKYHHTTEIVIKWQSCISLTFHFREIPGKTPHGTLPKSPCLVYSEMSDILIINFLLLLPLLPLCSFGHNFPFLVSNPKKLWTLEPSERIWNKKDTWENVTGAESRYLVLSPNCAIEIPSNWTCYLNVDDNFFKEGKKYS